MEMSVDKFLERALPKFTIQRDMMRDVLVIRLHHGTRMFFQELRIPISVLFEDMEEVEQQASFTADDMAIHPVIQSGYLRLMANYVKRASEIKDSVTKSDYLREKILYCVEERRL